MQAEFRGVGIGGACMPCSGSRPITVPSAFCALGKLLAATFADPSFFSWVVIATGGG